MGRKNEGRGRLTIAGVRARIDVLRTIAASGDHEAAHAEEDKLYEDVLEAIADGHAQPRGIATAVLVARDVDFRRDCA